MKKKTAIDALGSLAHEVRLDIFRLLVRAGPDGMAAGDIAGALSIAGPNLTFHLSHMRQAGLVGSRRAGRHVIYAADFGRMAALIDYLQENCCQGLAPLVAKTPAPEAKEKAKQKEPA